MPTQLMKIPSMTIPESFTASVIGFSIVFGVLVVLMCMVKILRGIMEAKATAAPAAAPAAAAAPASANMIPAKGSLGEVKLHDVEDKTAAMLMAIVADEMKAPLNELRFISIREKK
jgi:Oxaloacetate decarboxylase, gamma chain.